MIFVKNSISNVHHIYTTFLNCYKVIDVAEAAFIKDFFRGQYYKDSAEKPQGF